MKFSVAVGLALVVLVGCLIALEAKKRAGFADREADCRKHGTVIYTVREFICAYN